MDNIEYIKANGEYYHPQEAGKQIEGAIKGYCLPVCKIRKLMFGRWEVCYHDPFELGRGVSGRHIPNTRLVLYPAGIEEIKYLIN